jgi:hypothetical protein
MDDSSDNWLFMCLRRTSLACDIEAKCDAIWRSGWTTCLVKESNLIAHGSSVMNHQSVSWESLDDRPVARFSFKDEAATFL